MRRYACNRLYINNLCLSQAVVAINEKGKVEYYFLFSEELPATEWIGGVIVLSDKKERVGYSDFQDFREQMTSTKQLVYAWHVSDFDFQKEDFTPQSVVSRL